MSKLSKVLLDSSNKVFEDFKTHPLHRLVKNGLKGADDPNRLVFYRLFKLFSDGTPDAVRLFEECAEQCDKEEDKQYFIGSGEYFGNSMEQFKKEFHAFFNTESDSQWKAVQNEPEHKNLIAQCAVVEKAIAEKDPAKFLAINLGPFVLIKELFGNWHPDLFKAFPSQQYLASEQGIAALCDKIDSLAANSPSQEWLNKVKERYTEFLILDLDFYDYYAFGYNK